MSFALVESNHRCVKRGRQGRAHLPAETSEALSLFFFFFYPPLPEGGRRNAPTLPVTPAATEEVAQVKLRGAPVVKPSSRQPNPCKVGRRPPSPGHQAPELPPLHNQGQVAPLRLENQLRVARQPEQGLNSKGNCAAAGRDDKLHRLRTRPPPSGLVRTGENPSGEVLEEEEG
jgi:hypothetical protein